MVIKECFPDSAIAKEVKLNRMKSQNICGNIMAKYHKQDLTDELKKSKFSILGDESMDILVSQNLCIMVRYAGGNAFVNKFWDLVLVFRSDNPQTVSEGATSNRIFSAILKSFSDFVVPVDNWLCFRWL